jgi:hypothetical protein
MGAEKNGGHGEAEVRDSTDSCAKETKIVRVVGVSRSGTGTGSDGATVPDGFEGLPARGRSVSRP